MVGGTLFTWFLEGVPYFHLVRYCVRGPKSQFFPARFARHKIEHDFTISPLVNGHVWIDLEHILITLTTSRIGGGSPLFWRGTLFTPKIRDFWEIGGTLFTPKYPEFWRGGTLLRGGALFSIGWYTVTESKLPDFTENHKHEAELPLPL